MFVRILCIIARPIARGAILVFAAIFLSSGLVFAQNVSYQNLPQPGTLLKISQAESYPFFTGIRFNADDPLNLTFLADRAGKNSISKDEASRLIYYFLAGLTLPDNELWVNLSPYEKERIAGDHLAVTDLGRDMLAQDYILKQLTASLTYPESDGGKAYWSNVYDQAVKQLGTSNTSVNAFNKVWITPGAITIYEKDNAIFIASASLKVMTDFDYKALTQNLSETIDPTVEIAAQALREKIIPILVKEVNQGENFAPLRQIYRSLILATWFKRKFKDSFYKAYIGKAKVNGIDLAEKNSREKIFNLYVEAFKKGSYDYIRHEYDKRINKHLRRHYYSGGIEMDPGSIAHDATVLVLSKDARVAALGSDRSEEITGGLGASNFGHATTGVADGRQRVVPTPDKGVQVVALGSGDSEEITGKPGKGNAGAAHTDVSTGSSQVGSVPGEFMVVQAGGGRGEDSSTPAVNPFPDPAFMGINPTDEVLADWIEYGQRYRALLAADKDSTNPIGNAACARAVRAEMAAAQASRDVAQAATPSDKSKMREYRLTPYMEYLLTHASVEELGPLLSDTEFADGRYSVLVPDNGAIAIDQVRARRFASYLWLRVSKELGDRLQKAKKINDRKTTAMIDTIFGSNVPADNDTWQRLYDEYSLPLGEIPADITDRNNYRIFFGGTNLILVDIQGDTTRITLPDPGGCHPLKVLNDGAVKGAHVVRELAKENIPNLIIPIGEEDSVLRTGSVVTRYKTVAMGDSLDNLKWGDIPPAQRVRILLNVFVKVTGVLVEMHKRGWVHRDIKPQNIIVRINVDGTVGVVVTDLDIVEKQGTAYSIDKYVGSNAYAPPEVNPFVELRAEERAESVEFSWDDYTLGATLATFSRIVNGKGGGVITSLPIQEGWQSVPEAREILNEVTARLKEPNLKPGPGKKVRMTCEEAYTRLKQASDIVNENIPAVAVPVASRAKGTTPPVRSAAREQNRSSRIVLPTAPAVRIPSGESAVGISGKSGENEDENGGIDFNYRNFDIKNSNPGKMSSRYFTGVEYSGIILKTVTIKAISPSTSLFAWASVR